MGNLCPSNPLHKRILALSKLTMTGAIEIGERVISFEGSSVVELSAFATIHRRFAELGWRARRGSVLLLPRSIVCHVRRVVVFWERLVVAELGRWCAGGVSRRRGVKHLMVVCECDSNEEASEDCA